MQSSLHKRFPGARRVLVSLAAAALATAAASPRLGAQYAGVVVITEVNYHPAGGGQELEFIELHNASSAAVDLSDWFFSGGVSFVFPPGTWLDVGAYLVACASEARVRQAYGIENTVGDWASCDGERTGCALDNGGELIELSEPSGVPVVRLRYNDRGKWPAAADGTGHTLELAYVYSAQDDPDGWSASGSLGGSPGRPNETELHTVPVVVNEGLTSAAGDAWVELFNTSEEEVDLSGFFVTDERQNLAKTALPEGSRIAARGWLVLQAADLGLDLRPVASDAESPARSFFALSEPAAGGTGAARVVDAFIFEPRGEGVSEARLPDGDRSWSDWAVPTPGAANRIEVEDAIVINEVMYHPIDLNPDAEYLELHNRDSRRSIDLSGWRLTQGFNWTFAAGTVMAPESYLVVARSPRYIQETYGLSPAQVVGPDPDDPDAVEAFGRLRDDGERIVLRDPNGNIADSVRYHDGGQWPLWPDGGGSSLELIDPFQQNDAGGAWDASDDSGKSRAEPFSYQGTYVTGQPELHLALNHRGITVIDDLRLFERQVNFEAAQTFVDAGDEWKFFRGTREPSEPREAWRQVEFDDSSWESGPTPIGFGEGDEGTELADMRQSGENPGYLAVFCRKELFVGDLSSLETVVFDIEYDDGYIAYLNGVRIGWDNMREDPDGTLQDTFDARARRSAEKLRHQIDLVEFPGLLVEGRNVLAIQFHNSSATSPDARCIPQLRSGRFVTEDGPNQVANGDFEEELTLGLREGGWLIDGTHVRSGRTLVEPLSGSASLKLVASAKGDNKVNRLEQTLPALAVRGTYTIEFKARWIVGSPTLLTHGHNQASANFDYARTHELAVPRNLGTPGAQNSVTLRQIARTGSSNLGPVISGVEQDPAVPLPDQEVQVSARVEDPDGLSDVRLVYWLEDARGQPGPSQLHEVAMEGPGARGLHHATLPGQPLRTRVVFYITATDRGGREGRYPLDLPARTHPLMLDPENPQLFDLSFLIYRHDSPARPGHPRWQSFRFWMPYAGELQMQRQRLLSNDRMEGSFVFADRDIYYNSRVRFSGSPWARAGFGGSYRVYMPRDNPLHGSPSIKRFNMEDHQSGGSQSVLERLSHYLIRHTRGNITVPYSFQWLVQWQMNDRINTAREHVQTPNRQFVEFWFPGDDEGDMFEMDDRFEINDGGSRQNSIDARWTYPPMRSGDGEDKENYRWFFTTRLNKGLDDFTHLIETARVLDSRLTPDEEFDRVVWDHIHVEEMLRVWAIRMNTDDWDTWGTDRGKNCYVYRPYGDGRWHLFAWDMELTYGDVGRFMPPPITQLYSTINTGKFPDVFRLINRPRIKRLYYGIMAEMVEKPFNSGFLQPFMGRSSAVGMVNTDRMRPGGWIDQRNSRLRGILRSSVFPQQRLVITTNSGESFLSDTPVVAIEGRAPVEVVRIQPIINDLLPEAPAEVRFSDQDPLGWSAQVPLVPGANEVNFLGFNTASGLVDSDSIMVQFQAGKPVITSVIPDRVSTGQWVEIQGDQLHAGIQVLFGAESAPEVRYQGLPGSIAALVPSDLAPGTVSVVLRSTDASESEPFPIEILPSQGGNLFIRGDADLSGRLSISDGVRALLLLFGSRPLACLDAADADDSGGVNLSDALVVFNYLFRQGPAPANPFPDPGTDPTEDALGCERGL